MNKQVTGYIFLLGIMFGSTLLVSRFCVGQFNPFNYVGLRLSGVALGYLVIFLLRSRWRKEKIDRKLWKQGLIMGILYDALPFTLFVSALQYLSAGVASIMWTLYPVLVVLMAHVFLPDEQLSRRIILGVFLAMGGAVLMAILGESGLREPSQATTLGYILATASVLTAAVSTIYVRKQIVKFDLLDATSVRIFFAALIMMPLSIAVEGLDLSNVRDSGFIVMTLGIFINIVSVFLNFHILKRFGASIVSMADYITPIVATVGGVLLLGEQITWGIAAGMALTVSGVITVNSAPLTKSAKM